MGIKQPPLAQKPNAVSRVAGASIRPEFIRLPAVGAHCPYTGLMRDTLYRLVTGKQVKSVSLREKGKKRGVRLIHFDSLVNYLHAQMEVAN